MEEIYSGLGFAVFWFLVLLVVPTIFIASGTWLLGRMVQQAGLIKEFYQFYADKLKRGKIK